MSEKRSSGFNPAAVRALLEGDLENFLVAATPGGIEAQERAGQTSFVSGDYLPKRCPKEELEQLGFVFGKDKDDLFVYCQFPAGWKKEASDHAMWSTLLDDKGRKRGSIFYKAAFYDRDAFMSLDRRYSRDSFYGEYPVRDAYDSGMRYSGVEDRATGEILFHTEGCKRDDYKTSDRLDKLAKAWLKERFPDYDNALAYWD
jgi:hypothetical protein